MKRFIKIGAVGLIAAALIASLGFFAWIQANRYPAQPGLDAPTLPTGVARRAWRVFAPSAPTDTGFIFYPGGLVAADAYLWLGPQFAKRGIFTVIVPMPFELAVLDPSGARQVIQTYPDIKRWVIGGHSLGGAMAGRFLMQFPDEASKLVGLVLWGSRLSEDMDISDLPIRVASVYGSLDGVAPPGLTDAQRLRGLPPDARLFRIEGGNHSMFGDYGLQEGDTPLAIPLDEARRQIMAYSMTAFER